MRISLAFLLLCYWTFVVVLSKQAQKTSVIDGITDMKDFKKLLRTKTNVLACFINIPKKATSIVGIIKEAAEIIRGQGTMLIIECTGETKKMCKKLKIPSEEPYSIKHYKDGEFHKTYDRKETVVSIVSFMRDPTGDIPWNEDDSLGNDVVHLENIQSLLKFTKKDAIPTMIMFYAPWCGFCKQLKPEYSKAATTLKGKAVLAAIDVNKPENTAVRAAFNITGFPTLHYFKNGEVASTYDGENKHDDLVQFINNDGKAPPKPKEASWSDVPSDVLHLTDDDFHDVAGKKESMLVMFYAPWCGHCKKMKPEYEKAAARIKNENIKGVLAAVDATKERVLAMKYKVKGYPTLKYFIDGNEMYEVPKIRDADKILKFMKKPEKPQPSTETTEPEWQDVASEVIHLNVNNFKQILKKKRHALVMFYAPWCGHCKATKPEFIKAAEEVKDNLRMAFAAIDCTKYQTLCNVNDVAGYPTFKYFHYYNKATADYIGTRKKADFVAYLKTKDDERPTRDTSTEAESTIWTDLTNTDKILQLTDSNYEKIFKEHKSVFVMFYDKGCTTTCEEMLQDFIKTSKLMDNSLTILTSYDCKQNSKLITLHNVKNRPSLKYFKNGHFTSDYKSEITKTGIESFIRSLITKDEL